MSGSSPPRCRDGRDKGPVAQGSRPRAAFGLSYTAMAGAGTASVFTALLADRRGSRPALGRARCRPWRARRCGAGTRHDPRADRDDNPAGAGAGRGAGQHDVDVMASTGWRRPRPAGRRAGGPAPQARARRPHAALGPPAPPGADRLERLWHGRGVLTRPWPVGSAGGGPASAPLARSRRPHAALARRLRRRGTGLSASGTVAASSRGLGPPAPPEGGRPQRLWHGRGVLTRPWPAGSAGGGPLSAQHPPQRVPQRHPFGLGEPGQGLPGEPQ